MPEYSFSGLVPFAPTGIGIRVGLLKVDRIPPHLILCIGEKYFSLEKGRCTVNGHLPLLIAKLDRNRTKCLFLPLPALAKGEAIHLANGIYLGYQSADGHHSCLDPLKNFIHRAYRTDVNGVTVVFDLLDRWPVLPTGSTISQLNIDGGEVSLTRYDRDDVTRHIATMGRP